jgi:hypothetical protein
VNFNSVGYSGDEVKVTLLDNGQKIDEQIFKVNSERTNYTAIFEYTHRSTNPFGHTYGSRAVFENSCSSTAICERAYGCTTVMFSDTHRSTAIYGTHLSVCSNFLRHYQTTAIVEHLYLSTAIFEHT